MDCGILCVLLFHPQVPVSYTHLYTFEKIQEEFYTLEKGARRCLVELEGNPVGYIQIYQLDAALCREYHYPYREGELAFGIDQFIGEPALWNKGIGRAFISLVIDHLTAAERCV